MTVEEIKQRVTMRDVLTKYGVKVDRNGMCCCPIHQEQHPSMKVYKDGYKCFACNSAGDIFTFIQEKECCDFKTAFMILGGTYEHHNNKTAKVSSQMKFDRKRKEQQRIKQEEKRFRRILMDAIALCEWWIQNREPFSDDWCFAQNKILILWEEYEQKYIHDSEVNEVDVYRTCREIEQRFLAL